MIKLLKNLPKKEWLKVAICAMLVFMQVWLELKIPDYMSEITILVQREGSQMSDILKNGSFMLFCALGSVILAIFIGYLVSGIAATFSMNVREKLFKKVGKLSMNEIKEFSTSSLITRTTNDITQVQMLVVMGLSLFIRAPITVIWAITKILNKSWQWSALTAVSVVVLLSVISIIMAIVVPKFKVIQKLIDKLNGVTRENLTGIRVVRAFNAEKYQEDKFENVNNELTNVQLFTQKLFSLIMPVMYLVMYFLVLGIYIIGAILINEAQITEKLVLFGDMVVFSSYAMQIVMSFLMLAVIFMMLPRAQVSAKRINEVLDKEITLIDGHIDKNITNEIGTVEFKNVSFKYKNGEENILKNISFKVNRGETVAFIGSTGSGKSTLINLIPRFYDTTEGEVLIDGVNVKEYKQEFLNSKLGYVSQKAVMFNGTIKSNVAYGKKEYSEENIKEAIKVAQGAEFVEEMENKYDTHISQGGTNISGGQKQRLSIARAIVRKPEIYIFDDSFSALDYKTDKNLRKQLKEYTRNTTTLIVAQRIGTILNSDKIIVLDNGEIVGIGKHKDLLKNCEVYKQIALSQLSEEELINA